MSFELKLVSTYRDDPLIPTLGNPEGWTHELTSNKQFKNQVGVILAHQSRPASWKVRTLRTMSPEGIMCHSRCALPAPGLLLLALGGLISRDGSQPMPANFPSFRVSWIRSLGVRLSSTSRTFWHRQFGEWLLPLQDREEEIPIRLGPKVLSSPEEACSSLYSC